MTVLEFVDPLIDLLLGVLHRLTDLVPLLVCLVGCGVLVRLFYLLGSVFGIAPSLLRRTFGLVGNSLIGKFFVADRFANFLLDLPYSLLNLARNLILIHCFSPCRRKCGFLLCMKIWANRLGIGIELSTV